MNTEQARALLSYIYLAVDRPVPEHADAVWQDLLADLAYEDCLSAARQCLRVALYVPRPAEIRARAAAAAEDRRRLAAKGSVRPVEARRGRSGAGMVRHVLKRLQAAREGTPGGALGRERAGIIAEAACAEWLDANPATPGPG